jgi:hypothetical protein
VDLQERIARGHGEFLLFAITPPRASTSPEAAQQIADITLERLDAVRPDGLVLYDIDDESDRNPAERPFPFLPTMDPAVYLARHLAAWHAPVVVYRAVGKYDDPDLRAWLLEQDPRVLSVFVGASSREKGMATSLGQAYALSSALAPQLKVGAVAIPERHARRGDEHLRLVEKQQAGCAYFVTQVIYDVNAAKNLVSDYLYECRQRGVDPRPVVFTFSVCGSLKTLEFLAWLGIEVPRWINNELTHAADTLEASWEQALGAALEMVAFCRRLGMPFGLNVESVSNRRAEIEAAVSLAARLRQELQRGS